VPVDWSRLLPAVAAAVGALGALAGGSGVYYGREQAGERATVASERSASVAMLEVVATELERAAAREERCWGAMGLGAPPDEVLELEAAPIGEPPRKAPRRTRLERYDWWEKLPPQAQALARPPKATPP
jgi:hypothetical protein